MKVALALKGAIVKFIADVIKFYVNLHIMDAIVQKEIVNQIIVHVLKMEENVMIKLVKNV
jgi:hypothetical protein